MNRQAQLTQWLSLYFKQDDFQLTMLNGDAGFRRYFRLNINNQSFIAVDAPPEQSNNLSFIQQQEYLSTCGVIVPEVFSYDLKQGFLLLSDFGDTVLSHRLNDENMHTYYFDAINELKKFSRNDLQPNQNLMIFDDDFVLTELTIFSEWLLEKHLNIVLTTEDKKALKTCFTYLIQGIAQQPKVFMHRDYHSRNIMILKNKKLGIIDFQDAVYGPVTYDLVSLLRDCYIRWPEEKIVPLIESYRQDKIALFPDVEITKEKWQYWFDLTGLQRHLKAAGIFARLHHRDNKSAYLADIPLTLTYIVDISAKYQPLQFLQQLVNERVIPKVVYD